MANIYITETQKSAARSHFLEETPPEMDEARGGRMNPIEARGKKGAISLLTLAGQSARAPAPGNWKTLSKSSPSGACCIPKRWRARYFSAKASSFRGRVRRLSLSSKPDMPGYRSAKGAPDPRGRATRSIISLKAYASPPRLFATSFPVNFDVTRRRRHGPLKVEAADPIAKPRRIFPSRD